MFKFWRNKKSKKVFTNTAITYPLYADDVEYIVAYTLVEITTKKGMKQAISNYLFYHGLDFDPGNLSDDAAVVDEKLTEARKTVKRLMPELYK